MARCCRHGDDSPRAALARQLLILGACLGISFIFLLAAGACGGV